MALVPLVFWALAGRVGLRPRAVKKYSFDDSAVAQYYLAMRQLHPCAVFALLVPKGRTVFLDLAQAYLPYPNQWAFLDAATRVEEGLLDDVIEVNDLRAIPKCTTVSCKTLGTFEASFALPPCAQSMLAPGVTAYQRVSCFRLVVHLRRVGLPFDLVVATLSEWSGKNRPADGRLVEGPHGEMVKIDFMLSGDDDCDGRQVSGVASRRLSENTKLGRWVSAILGSVPEVGEEVKAQNLLHKDCRVVVRHRTNPEGQLFANVVEVLPHGAPLA